ncbi:hypothetical protein QAD02_006376 [Eretmocerus hayati]|uniref:Uncharacterized protein n=1 Tax=Eretmocerus hayati TaxID=131215 RepID=A0ACC2N325_9HYME|nr:hypothetical protein QAD02_006376 [Eretmocerus hayati]
MYYDGVLQALKTDQREQNRLTMRTTLIGQLAHETLDDVRLKYKRIARDVWINMKERERSLEITKRKVDEIWACAKSLVRIDSDTNLAKKKKDKAVDIDGKLEQEIKDLEDVFDKMKGMLKVRTYEELLVRLREQVKKKQNLTYLYNRNMKELDFIKNTKNHAEKMLQNLNHSMVSSTNRYKTDKVEMREKMKDEKQRQVDNKNMIEARGELLMTIRAALQSVSSVLVCIPADKTAISRLKPVRKGSKRGSKESRSSKISKIEQEVKKVEEQEKESAEKAKDSKKKSMCDDPVETEGLAVLEQVTLKAVTLFHMTDFDLNEERQEIAQDHYDAYITQYHSKLRFGDGEEEETGMDFEHEIADQGVPTRAEIKKKSKHIVELSTKAD